MPRNRELESVRAAQRAAAEQKLAVELRAIEDGTRGSIVHGQASHQRTQTIGDAPVPHLVPIDEQGASAIYPAESQRRLSKPYDSLVRGLGKIADERGLALQDDILAPPAQMPIEAQTETPVEHNPKVQ
jgi:hypothetical protein